MRKKPPGELFELLERTLEVLRATKEALLEQRREIRSLATAVDSLRSRVDQLVLSRSEPPRHVEPEPEPEPEPQPVPQAELEAEAEPEPELEPELPPAAEAEPEPADEYRHEDEYDEPETTREHAYDVAVEEYQSEERQFEPVYEEPASAEPVAEEFVAEAPPEPQHAVPEVSAEHVLMLSTAAGYRLVTGAGAEPESNVEIDGVVYLVGQRVSSPFPGDERPTFVATRVAAADDEY